jgi:hypothetical protein
MGFVSWMGLGLFLLVNSAGAGMAPLTFPQKGEVEGAMNAIWRVFPYSERYQRITEFYQSGRIGVAIRRPGETIYAAGTEWPILSKARMVIYPNNIPDLVANPIYATDSSRADKSGRNLAYLWCDRMALQASLVHESVHMDQSGHWVSFLTLSKRFDHEVAAYAEELRYLLKLKSLIQKTERVGLVFDVRSVRVDPLGDRYLQNSDILSVYLSGQKECLDEKINEVKGAFESSKNNKES